VTQHTSLHDEVVALTQDLIRLDTSNAPGNETLVAEHLASYLARNGVDCELVARDPARANLVAKLPGSDPTATSMAFVGHIDVVPVDPRDWTHPPFEAVIDDAGYLYGRGAIDMKNEVAARAVAMAELARTGFRPRGDLWFVAEADEEDGTADVGMRWLLEERPDIRPDLAVNEGGGHRLELADGRTVLTVGVGEKGTFPARVSSLGEAGHGSTPSAGDNGVLLLGELLRRIGRGMPVLETHPLVEAMLDALVPASTVETLEQRIVAAAALHPAFEHVLPALPGVTMAPTMLGGSPKRNVIPARAWMELDCRILPGHTEADVEKAVRARLGDGLDYELTWPEELVPGSGSTPDSLLMDSFRSVLARHDPDALLLPVLDTGFTDSLYLRQAGGAVAYGFSPFRTTPAEVINAGYHNADERVHVDDLLLATQFHVDLAREVLGDTAD